MDRSNQNQGSGGNINAGYTAAPNVHRPALLPRPNLSPVDSSMFSLPPPSIGMNNYQRSNSDMRQAQLQNFNTPPLSDSNSINSLPQNSGITSKLVNLRLI